MKAFARDHGLSLFFLAIFLLSLGGHALVGHSDYNADQVEHGQRAVSLGAYLTSSAYWVDVMENWQSEYLQFVLFVLATVWLVQRGSTESKAPGDEGLESDEEQKLGRYVREDSPKWARAGGWRTAVYSNSLALVMGTIFFGSWFAQLVTGRVEYNEEELEHGQEVLSLLQYAGSSDFWSRTLQNWQSEFLAVASMVVFSVWLRQRGSSQSKPVGAPHTATAEEG